MSKVSIDNRILLRCAYVVSLTLIFSLAAEPSQRSYLSAEELLQLYESMYSRIQNIHVRYTLVLDEIKDESGEMPRYTRFTRAENLEEKFGERYYIRWTRDPNHFPENNLFPQEAFNGSAASRYLPSLKQGNIAPGRTGLTGEQMSQFWCFMMLDIPRPNEQPDMPRIQYYFSPESTVRPELEQVNGEWCHVIDAPYTVKPWATVWIAADKGGLPMKFEKPELGPGLEGRMRRRLITKVGSIKTDTGEIWYPEQATNEIHDRNGYRLYRFSVQSLKMNIKTTPDMFNVSFPEGTDVIDRVAGLIYTTGAFDEKMNIQVFEDPTKNDEQQLPSSKEDAKPSTQKSLSVGNSESRKTDMRETHEGGANILEQSLGQLRLSRTLAAALGILVVAILALLTYYKLVR